MPQQYLFIVSAGRSGSTLTQGLVNALPRTLVRGENNFYLLPLFRAQARVHNYQRRFGQHSARVSSAHYGIAGFDIPRYTAMIRDWTLGSLLDDVDPGGIDRIGFKEVHWNEVTAGEEKAFFAWFERLFPGARYVLNHRAPDDVVHSGHYREVTEEAATAIVKRVADVQAFLRESRPDRTHEQSAELRGLAEFVLGSCSDDLLAELRAVTKVGHGPYPFGASRGQNVQ